MTSWPWAKRSSITKNAMLMTVGCGKLSQQKRTSGRNDEQDVLRHKQTLFSSSWMPLVRIYKEWSHCHEKCDCHTVALRSWLKSAQSISSVKCPIVYRSTRKYCNVFFERWPRFASVFTTEDGNVGRCHGISGTRSPCAGVSERQGMRWFSIAVMCNCSPERSDHCFDQCGFCGER